MASQPKQLTLKIQSWKICVTVNIFRPYFAAVCTYPYRNDRQTSNAHSANPRALLTLSANSDWCSHYRREQSPLFDANGSVWGERWKDKERRPLILIKDNELSPKIKRKRVLSICRRMLRVNVWGTQRGRKITEIECCNVRQDADIQSNGIHAHRTWCHRHLDALTYRPQGPRGRSLALISSYHQLTLHPPPKNEYRMDKMKYECFQYRLGLRNKSISHGSQQSRRDSTWQP